MHDVLKLFQLFFFIVNAAYSMEYLINLLKSHRSNINNDTLYTFGIVGITTLIGKQYCTTHNMCSLCDSTTL